ncbi:hypothetical protein AVEN_267991-1 [Araneus ventricosus]|uniref:Uncharacterized protein n=1 Tax=Araneus ventricosus TaxID=182803 RepID=A0A4Y2HPY7_ARAVE|nr:hypothetical protein AVEN_267991-1 [Araneus ventricosus]
MVIFLPEALTKTAYFLLHTKFPVLFFGMKKNLSTKRLDEKHFSGIDKLRYLWENSVIVVTRIGNTGKPEEKEKISLPICCTGKPVRENLDRPYTVGPNLLKG